MSDPASGTGPSATPARGPAPRPAHALLDVVGAAGGHDRRLVRHAAVAVVAAAAGLAAIRGAFPESVREQETVRVKLAAVQSLGAETDVVFFGSSVVQFHLDPAAVDARLAERGHRLRSFNAGLGAAWAFETDAMVRRFLESPPPRVRWAVVEVRPHDPRIAEQHVLTERSIRWHDLRQTSVAIRACFHWPMEALERVRLAGVHVQHAAVAEFLLGTGPAAVAAGTDGEAARFRGLVAEAAGSRGFTSLDDLSARDARTAESRARFVARLREYEALRDAAAGPDAEASAAGWVDRDAVASQVAALRGRGIEPVYFVAPVLRRLAALDAAIADGVYPHVLAFDDPRRHPDLFAVENRFDFGHLNARGAEILSRRFADLFADVLEGKRP